MCEKDIYKTMWSGYAMFMTSIKGMAIVISRFFNIWNIKIAFVKLIFIFKILLKFRFSFKIQSFDGINVSLS